MPSLYTFEGSQACNKILNTISCNKAIKTTSSLLVLIFIDFMLYISLYPRLNFQFCNTFLKCHFKTVQQVTYHYPTCLDVTIIFCKQEMCLFKTTKQRPPFSMVNPIGYVAEICILYVKRVPISHY